MTGWIKIHRKMVDWEWYSDQNTTRLFFHLLLTANYEPSRYRGHDIPSGSVVIGLNALAEQTGLSVRKVRTALDHLKSTSEVTIKSNNIFSILSINKWKEYQSLDKPTDNQMTNDRQSNDKRMTTSKERKKERKEEYKKEGIPGLVFPDWFPLKEWDQYCQHRGAKFTHRAKELAIAKLVGWHNLGHNAGEILNNSIMNGWAGLFEPKEKKLNGTKNRSQLADDATARALARYSEAHSPPDAPELRHLQHIRDDPGSTGDEDFNYDRDVNEVLEG